MKMSGGRGLPPGPRTALDRGSKTKDAIFILEANRPLGLIGDRFSDPSFLDFFDDWIILDHSYILHQVGVSWYGHLRFPP